ncbi:TATA-binding protein-associated factor 2N-like [Cimex lectularius]|uniref:CPR type cuticle protein n=1 Tax=Cimex lectularius TaxID=79782 RepID=A0A8I6SJI5_CIMLE|nr:TATA-binding protein-associated factor 2N-like [Cimex lectularius]XP_024082298.1 TATA-binding protein-associated factor 2N-like [Cimex lectularius]XP_024082306.1 TATA-binding protein-associated factor 2N-like [Cimex lectularius]XP_024082309.1 TATA-binding protein-associated factor 2N-like [Cimex lectularius]
MGKASGNRTSNTLLGLALSAIYLNLSLSTANGSQFYQLGPMLPINLPLPGPTPWQEALGGYALGSNSGYRGFSDGSRDTGGYYNDLFSKKNAYDLGKGYGNGIDYGRGGVIGGGFRDLGGRNKGHQAAGFATSYRKDESGDQATYYDDGLGHHGKINYGAHDARFRDQGGSLRRGGYHDTNLNRAATGKAGRYGDNFGYRGYLGHDGSFADGRGGYGYKKGWRHGRLLPLAPLPGVGILRPPPTFKSTGLYVIPMPNKFYFDHTIAPPA